MAIWDIPTPTDSIPSSSSQAACSSFTLPSDGIIQLAATSTITLLSDAVFQPRCTSLGLEEADVSTPSSVEDFRDPFYASTLPQCFALAATTVIAYMLVIMLLITPRTFLSGGTVVLGRRGFTSGHGNGGGVGIGGRPWLQKVAALTVAVSLTIATVDTFRVAEEQYETGYANAKALQNEVLNSTELKVIRVISDTFLWLAQAQTLIRLFPRHREKVIIKWTAFALILLDLTFSILNNFVFGYSNTRPRSFQDAIPALSYLFQLALGLLYCAWVIYYAITKKTYAFYHKNMRNICLVALLSIIAVIVPVVFFVLDISKPTLAGWGDYVRWVGAAAASVVVWEWVERIEALERNDRKDGVLGREVFDGDEMLEVTPSFDHFANRRGRGDRGGATDGSTTGAAGTTWPAMSGIANRFGQGRNELRKNQNYTRILGRPIESLNPSNWPSRPPPAATPISRTDTASAESTIYAIRYHPISDSRGAVDELPVPSLPTPGSVNDVEAQIASETDRSVEIETDALNEAAGNGVANGHHSLNPWESLQKVNLFRRKGKELPRVVAAHTKTIEKTSEGDGRSNKWDVLGRLEDFAAVQADKLREKAKPTHDIPSLPVTRIPAPSRARKLEEITEELLNTENAEPSRPVARTVRDMMADSPTRVNAGDVLLSSPSVTRNRYIPANLNDTAVIHRGSLSFATSVQKDVDCRLARPNASSPPSDDGRASTPHSPVGRDMTCNSSIGSQDADIARLPVIRIPAPPRCPKTED